MATCLGLALISAPGQAAGQADGPADTVRTLTARDVYQSLMQWHPVVRQANLLPQSAHADVRQARGLFDPKLQSDLARKEFKGKEYYTLWDTNLKVPLWPGGVDLKAGYERNQGAYLDPEHTVPGAGLAYAGLSVPVSSLVGLDERRATLKQALLYQEMAEAERVKLTNKVVFTALKAYWDWYEAARRRELLREATQLAVERYLATSGRVLAGDLAAIDTLEAGLLVRERRVAEQQAHLDAFQTALALSTHLWADGNQPVMLDPRATPPAVGPAQAQPLNAPELHDRLAFVAERHPEVQKLLLKNQQLRVEERWRRTDLLPDLNLSYNFLSTGFGVPTAEGTPAPWLANSYKLGAQLSVPLFMRKERGKLQSVRLKQVQNDLELLQLRRELTAAVRQAAAEQQTLAGLLGQQRQMAQAYRALRQGEVDKFDAGESTVFLVNSRDSKLIEAELKLVQLEAKYQKARAGLVAAVGSMDWEQ